MRLLPRFKKSDDGQDQQPPPRTVWDDITVAAVPTVIAITIQKLLDELFDWLKQPKPKEEEESSDDDDESEEEEDDDEFEEDDDDEEEE